MNKRILSLCLALALLLCLLPATPTAAAAGYVAINETNFPDEIFRGYVSGNFDPDGDGLLSPTEISNVTKIKCSGCGIASLKGIEYFTALERLICYENRLTSLDVSKNTALTELDCSGNQLTSLDVSKNTALKKLECYSNQLTSLDVSKNTALTELSCSNNQLTSLDVSKNTALKTLVCSGNQLTSLDVSGCTALEWLSCDGNQLPSLDLSKNTALEYLDCYYNQLTSLDVSRNTALETLYCGGNQLTSLDVSKNTALNTLYCDNNQLTSLNVSGCTALKQLWCSDNRLTSLDVSKNTALEVLWCYNNQLTSLDVSKNTALEELYCYNNHLTSLDVSKNQELWSLACYGNKLTVLNVSAVPYLLYALENGEKTVEDEYDEYSTEQGRIRMDHDQNTISTPPAVSVKVTWKIGSSSKTTEVPVGTVPVYQGETPSKPSTATSHYIFAGWKSGNTTYKPANLPKVTGDITFTAVFQAVDHSFTARITSKPTCTQAGVKTFTCACGYSYTEKVAALGHSFGAWTTVTSATCTASGTETRTCARCGKNEYRAIPALGHAESGWIIDRNPSCTASGTRHTECTICGATIQTDVIAALGHDYVNGVCSRCGKKESAQNPFGDVKEKDYYYAPVMWAVSHEPQITAGTSKTKFSPSEDCTRAQVVTFLWRAAGAPEPKTATNPFQDVRQKDYFYKAVLWAVENGITSGTSKTRFSPNESCTRAQVVTFLWRYEKQSNPKSAANPFKDVKADAYYYKAVLWAVENGVTSGTSKTKFSPDDTCTRGQIVTFLYRDLAGK